MGTFIICGSFTASAGSENRIVLFQHLYKCVQQRPSDSFLVVLPSSSFLLFILFFLFERVPPGNSRICGFLSLIHKNRTQHITTIVSSSLSFIFYLFLSRIRCSRSSSVKEVFFFLFFSFNSRTRELCGRPSSSAWRNALIIKKKIYEYSSLSLSFLLFFFVVVVLRRKEKKEEE